MPGRWSEGGRKLVDGCGRGRGKVAIVGGGGCSSFVIDGEDEGWMEVELMEGEEDAKELDKELPNDGDKEDGDASNVEIGTIRSFLALP